MPTINGKVCVVNGVPVDKVFSNGKQVYGRNLAPSNNSDWVKVATGGWGTTNISNHIYEIKGGQTYTASLEIKNITNSLRLEFFAITAEGVRNGGITSGYFIGTGSSGIVSYTFTATLYDKTSYVLPDLAFTQALNTVGSYEYRRFKIERGSIATPWSPAPEDVLKNYIAAPKNLKATVIDLSTEKLDWE